MSEVQHTEGRFYIKGREKAVLDYSMEGSDVMRITHTYVPDEMRGLGIAKRLVLFAVEFAKERNYKIKPICSYVKVFFEKHEDHQVVLAD